MNDGQEMVSDLLESRGMGALMDRMGMEILEAGPDKVVARIPVEGNTQSIGLLHGGASACLAETIASVGSWLTNPTKITLGVDIKVNHLRPARSGWVTGVGLPLHSGRTLAVWEIRISDDTGKQTAFSTCTIALRDPE